MAFIYFLIHIPWHPVLLNLNCPRSYARPKGIFGNCFFPLFSVFKNNFLFLRLKNLFGNSKLAENKNCFQNSICEEN